MLILEDFNFYDTLFLDEIFPIFESSKNEEKRDDEYFINKSNMVLRGNEAIKKLISANLPNYENIIKNKSFWEINSSHDAIDKAMYRDDLGWIGLAWGTRGKLPPDKNKNPARYENFLKKVYSFPHHAFRDGYGLSHIIAKRIWESTEIKETFGQEIDGFVKRIPRIVVYGALTIAGDNTTFSINTNSGTESVYATKALRNRNSLRLLKFSNKKIPDSLATAEEYWIVTGYKNTKTYTPIGLFENCITESAGERKNPKKSYAGSGCQALGLRETAHGTESLDPAKDHGSPILLLPTALPSGGSTLKAGAADLLFEKIPHSSATDKGKTVMRTLFFDKTKKSADDILERASLNALNTAVDGLKKAKTFEDIYAVFQRAFTPIQVPEITTRATPLFDRLQAGEFNSFPRNQFVAMIGRINSEESVPITAMHDAICAYLEANEPLQGFNLSALAA